MTNSSSFSPATAQPDRRLLEDRLSMFVIEAVLLRQTELSFSLVWRADPPGREHSRSVQRFSVPLRKEPMKGTFSNPRPVRRACRETMGEQWGNFCFVHWQS